MFRRRSVGSSRSVSPAAPDFGEDIEILSMHSMSEDIPPPIRESHDNEEINVEEEEATPLGLSGDTSLNPDIQFRYTSGHPMGSILLRLLNENMKLAERIGHRNMDLSAQELATQFYNWQLSEKQKIKSKIMQTTAGLEESILTREMSSHTINQSIEPPSSFSPVPTLLTARQRADCFKLLPSGSNKFSGDRGMSILEYLHNLKSFQNQNNLSLSEFYDALLASTTGNAYVLLSSWIDNNETPATIFHNLLIHYDKRLQPEEARAKLMAYKAPKTADLAKVEAMIMGLASRAASSIPAGPGRTANYNMEVIQGLIRGLPHASSLIVQNQNMEKSAKLGRMLTAAELSRYLNVYRHAIDSDIKSHGVDPRSFEKRFLPRAKINGARKYSAYNITGAAPLQYQSQAPQMITQRIQRHSTISTNQVSQNNKPSALGGSRNFRDGNNNDRYSGNRNMRTNWSGQQAPRNSRNNRTPGYRGGRSNSNFTPRRGPPNGNNYNKFATNYCSLCGRRNHTAASGCEFMVSDDGVRVPIMPTKQVCTKCPPFVNPRLSHPENICPYRKGGPWGKQ